MPKPDPVSASDAQDAFVVMVADNYHYMNKDEWWTLGTFPTAEDAIAAAKAVVEGSLDESYEPGMSAEGLYGQYTMFGEDPFIVAKGAGQVAFSAWNYAKVRSAELIAERLANAPVKPPS